MLDLLWQRAAETRASSRWWARDVVLSASIHFEHLQFTYASMFVCFCRAFIFLSFFVRKWIIYINFVRYADANHFTNRCSIVCKWFAHKMKSENATGKQTAFVFVYKLCASMRRTMISCRNRNMGVWEQQNNNTILTRNYQIGMKRERKRDWRSAHSASKTKATRLNPFYFISFICFCVYLLVLFRLLPLLGTSSFGSEWRREKRGEKTLFPPHAVDMCSEFRK